MKNVIVTKYNPEWTRQFKLLHEFIWPHISDISMSLEHVGSTSVPGLSAKPIIDLTIIVSSPENLALVIQRLSSIGALHKGNLGIEGREVFARLEGFPDHNLYACINDSQPLANHLAVRNALRLNTELVKEYGELKLKLAKQYPQDIESYVESKSEFLLSILKAQGFQSGDLKDIQKINRRKKEI